MERARLENFNKTARRTLQLEGPESLMLLFDEIGDDFNINKLCLKMIKILTLLYAQQDRHEGGLLKMVDLLEQWVETGLNPGKPTGSRKEKAAGKPDNVKEPTTPFSFSMPVRYTNFMSMLSKDHNRSRILVQLIDILQCIYEYQDEFPGGVFSTLDRLREIALTDPRLCPPKPVKLIVLKPDERNEER